MRDGRCHVPVPPLTMLEVITCADILSKIALQRAISVYVCAEGRAAKTRVTGIFSIASRRPVEGVQSPEPCLVLRPRHRGGSFLPESRQKSATIPTKLAVTGRNSGLERW